MQMMYLMKLKTHDLLIAIFCMTLQMYSLSHAFSVTSKIENAAVSGEDSPKKTHTSNVETSTSRIVVSSSWVNVATPLVSGVNHENHRGSAWIDFDNDGFQDLYLTHFGVFDPEGDYLGAPNQLLRNLGNGEFEDVTTLAIEAESGLSHHAAWADINNDGLPDMYVSQSSNSGTETSALLRQNSIGIFENITSGDPLAMHWILPRGVAWQDVNNDGLIDVLITNSGGDDFRNRLLLNMGDDSFSKVQNSALSGPGREGRGVAWCDFNNDSLPDIYIGNGAEDNIDEHARTNQLFLNNGDGTWLDIASIAGVADVGHARGVVWGDINNDGLMDLFIGNQKGSDTGGGHNKFYMNNGNGTFTDITLSSGTFGSYRTRCVSMADFDNDGYLDLYVVNFGNAQPPNHLFRNNGNGTFTEVASGTLAQGQLENGSSATWSDFDNDGWVDLYTVGGSTEAPGEGMNQLLRNTNHNGNHWIEIELCGTISNRSAIGARIRIEHRDSEGILITQMRDIQSGSGYNSMHMLRAHFGLGQSEVVQEIAIQWPSGIIQTLNNYRVDKIIRVVEDEGFAFDCNRNCVPDIVDIQNGYSSDIDGDGIPDECDCAADFNNDDVVDVHDFLQIIINWDVQGVTPEDISQNGVVDVKDLIMVIAAWGLCD